MLVTLRARYGLPSLRTDRVSGMLRSVLFDQRKRRYAAEFQVVEFSIQEKHLHLIVEATGENAHNTLRAGVTGLVVAFVKRLNMMLGRKGRVWADRWHGRELPSPREVRNRLVYVFRNGPRSPASGSGSASTALHHLATPMKSSTFTLTVSVAALCITASCTPLPDLGDDGGRAGASSSSPDGTNGNARQQPATAELFEHPTQALVDQMLADHVPTAEETDLIAVYWAGMIVSRETGAFPEGFVSYDIAGRVAALAKLYPTFFVMQSGGGFGPVLVPIKPASDPPGGSVDCNESCEGKLLVLEVLGNCVEGIGLGVKLYKYGADAKKLAGGIGEGLKAAGKLGLSPVDAIRAAANGKAVDLTFAVVDGTLAAITLGVAAGALTLSPAAIAGFAIVGGISSAIQCGYGIVQAYDGYKQCKAAQAAYCKCSGVVCAAPKTECEGTEAEDLRPLLHRERVVDDDADRARLRAKNPSEEMLAEQVGVPRAAREEAVERGPMPPARHVGGDERRRHRVSALRENPAAQNDDKTYEAGTSERGGGSSLPRPRVICDRACAWLVV